MGKLYTLVDRKIEDLAGRAAEVIGYGPRVVATKLLSIQQDSSLSFSRRDKGLIEGCKLMELYVKYAHMNENVPGMAD